MKKKVRRLGWCEKAKSIRFILHLGLNVNFRPHSAIRRISYLIISPNADTEAEEVKIKCEPKISLSQNVTPNQSMSIKYIVFTAATRLAFVLCICYALVNIISLISGFDSRKFVVILHTCNINSFRPFHSTSHRSVASVASFNTRPILSHTRIQLTMFSLFSHFLLSPPLCGGA